MEIQKLAASFVPVPSWFLKDKDDILDSSVCFCHLANHLIITVKMHRKHLILIQNSSWCRI